MSIAALINRPCTLFRQVEGAPDDYGDPMITFDEGTETVCELQGQPGLRSTREGAELQLETTRWVIYLPAGTELAGGDYLMVDEERYDLEGDPDEVRNPRTRQEGYVMVRARRTR